tara:strand:- start:6 stop:923 length:918 start_codon:yes stop_codon:yes gene_type:complete
MALDKQFLKYKLEKIKNDRIYKQMPPDGKRDARKKNAKLAQEEADAYHSYITGEDNIDKFDNRSFLENRLPGSLTITDKGQLNIIPIQKEKNIKKSRKLGKISFRRKLLGKFRNIKVLNRHYDNRLTRIKKIFNALDVTFKKDVVSINGDLKVLGNMEAQTLDAQIEPDFDSEWLPLAGHNPNHPGGSSVRIRKLPHGLLLDGNAPKFVSVWNKDRYGDWQGRAATNRIYKAKPFGRHHSEHWTGWDWSIDDTNVYLQAYDQYHMFWTWHDGTTNENGATNLSAPYSRGWNRFWNKMDVKVQIWK